MNCAEKKNPDAQLCESIPERLQNYMKTLQFFDDDIEDYLYMYDLNAERIYFTNKIRKRFPLPLGEDNGINAGDWDQIVYSKDREFMNDYRYRLIHGKIKSFNIAYRIIDIDEKKVWINVKGMIREEVGRESKLLVGRISEMVLGRMVDGLTGLCSTEKFMEDLDYYLKMDNGGYLMVLGVDNFKNINITQGRTAGDEILKQITLAMEHYSEYPLSLYRLDGDCFAVIFPDKQEHEVTEFYHDVQNEMKGACTISAGVVAYQGKSTLDSGAIYQYAENALDQAKECGKDTLVFFSQNNYQKGVEQVELLDEFKASIEQECKGFSLYYQPQFNSQTFEINGVEALLRYCSPSKGSLSPAEFIPLLEKSGLICPVGEWVLKTALLQCREWRKSLPNLRVSVNLSQVQLQQIEITNRVLEIVRETGLPGEALMLEVTESRQLQDYIHLNKIFCTWKQHGIKTSIDDFGTGYSSLSYLKSIEVDEIKIDRCFVDHVQCNAYNYRLLKNMIELAHSAKIEVCCEGVETFEEFLALQELHTDIYQGYLFAKPYTKEMFEENFIVQESTAYQDRKSREDYYKQFKPGDHQKVFDDFRKEEIGNITESMEELVYISDIDTYELYYLNAAGRRATGVYDYNGRKCYQVLHGRQKPCEWCNNHCLCEKEFYVWENENKHLNKNYILKDKLIHWQGKIVRLEMAIDITEKEIVSRSIQKKLDFEQAIVNSCRILASESTPEEIAYNVVRVIGEFCQGSRAYILKIRDGGSLYDLYSEWYAKGVKSVRSYFPHKAEGLKDMNSSVRIASCIKRGNKVIGLVGVDNPRYKEDGNELVKTMAYFLGYSMMGEENQQKLNHLKENRYKDILNHTDLGLWEIRINPENGEGELYPDRVLCRIMGMSENMTPKENYHHWYSRIKDGYIDYINRYVDQMIQGGRIIHLEYPWLFPTGEEKIVQCVGIRREDCDGKICLEGYHWVIGGEEKAE